MKGLIRSSLSTLRGCPRYELLAEYDELQWQDPEFLRDYQWERLRWVLTHASDTVPYYREMLGRVGLDPNEPFSAEEYATLPVLTKEIIREQGYSMLSTAVDPKAVITNNSGGSTGEPLQFYQDRHVFEEMSANWMLGLSFVGWTPDDLVVSFWGNPREFERKPSLLARAKSWLGGNISLNAYKYNREIMGQWVETLNHLGPLFIYGYVSVLADFAEYLLEHGNPVKGVKGVVTSAEKLHDHQRKVIGKAFGCGVFDQYGSREIPCIAAECDHGNMHLLLQSAYVEFLPNEDGPGKRVVVTSLNNRTMPFIRYEIGDYASPQPGNCSCGRGFPLMKMDIGRNCDTLVTPNGNTVFGTYFVRQMYGIAGVAAFQFRQQVPYRIELHIVRGKGFSDESGKALVAVRENFRRELGEDILLDVKYVDEIPRTQGGKHRHVICEVGG